VTRKDSHLILMEIMGQDRLVGEVAKLDGKQIFYVFEVRQWLGGGEIRTSMSTISAE